MRPKRYEKKNEVCDSETAVYMDNFRLDPDKVASSRLTGEDASLGYLSKEAYNAYKGSINEYEKAEKLIRDSGKYVDDKGNPDSIDKGLFDRGLTFTDPPSSNEANAENPSSNETNAENPASSKDL